MPLIKNIFNIIGGNNGLTEEFIYQNQPTTDEDSIPILSSATVKTNLMGYISQKTQWRNDRKLKIFSAPVIIVTRNGFAGKMSFIEKGEFTINDHAYVMTPKEAWKKKINLRWFVSQYQELFKNLITSKSDNATFSKEYAEKQNVSIPDIGIQERIAQKLLKIDVLIDELESTKEQLLSLSEYQITSK